MFYDIYIIFIIRAYPPELTYGVEAVTFPRQSISRGSTLRNLLIIVNVVLLVTAEVVENVQLNLLNCFLTFTVLKFGQTNYMVMWSIVFQFKKSPVSGYLTYYNNTITLFSLKSLQVDTLCRFNSDRLYVSLLVGEYSLKYWHFNCKNCETGPLHSFYEAINHHFGQIAN